MKYMQQEQNDKINDKINDDKFTWQTFKNSISNNLTSIKVGLIIMSFLFLYYVYISQTPHKIIQTGGGAITTVAAAPFKLAGGITKGAVKGTYGLTKGVVKGTAGLTKGVFKGTAGLAKGAFKGTSAISKGAGSVLQTGTKGLGAGIDKAKMGLGKLSKVSPLQGGFSILFQFVNVFMMIFGIIIILVIIPTIPILIFFVISYFICRRKIWELRTL
jgi:hypothetical protein